MDTFWYSTNPHFERPMVGRLNYSRPWTMLSLQPMGHVVDIVLDEREEVPDERMHSMRLQYTSAALRARVHDAHKGQCLRRVGSGHSTCIVVFHYIYLCKRELVGHFFDKQIPAKTCYPIAIVCSPVQHSSQPKCDIDTAQCWDSKEARVSLTLCEHYTRFCVSGWDERENSSLTSLTTERYPVMANIPGEKFVASNMWHGKRVTVEYLSWSRICKWE